MRRDVLLVLVLIFIWLALTFTGVAVYIHSVQDPPCPTSQGDRPGQD
jgi:hypothetical protein